MFGNATLNIPATRTATHGVIGPTWVEGLSDDLAMTIGRLAARTLSEHDGPVIVYLENGSVIGLEHSADGLSGIDMEVIRRCGGFREYAAFVGGPII